MNVQLLFFLSKTPNWFLYLTVVILVVIATLLVQLFKDFQSVKKDINNFTSEISMVAKDTEIIRRITEKNNKADLFHKTTIISSKEFRNLANKTKNQ